MIVKIGATAIVMVFNFTTRKKSARTIGEGKVEINERIRLYGIEYKKTFCGRQNKKG